MNSAGERQTKQYSKPSEWRHVAPLIGGDFIIVGALILILGTGAVVAQTFTPDPSSFLPEPCREKGVTDPAACRQLMEEHAVSSQLPPPSSTPTTLPAPCAERGITDPAQCQELMIRLSQPPLPPTGELSPTTAVPFSPPPSVAPVGEVRLPPVCAEKGITDPRLCEELLSSLKPLGVEPRFPPPLTTEPREGFMPTSEGQAMPSFARPEEVRAFESFVKFFPLPCQEAGVKTPDECRRLMEERGFSGLAPGQQPPASPRPGFSMPPGQPFTDFSREGVIQAMQDFLPPPCRAKGLTDPVECQRVLFLEHAPPECREAGLNSPEQCERHLTERFLPPPCRAAGIRDPKECEQAIIVKHLPEECRRAGAKTPEECEQAMTSAYGPKICQERGAKSEVECQRLVFATYGRPKGCEGLSDDECRLRIETGEVEAEELFQKLNNELSPRCKEQGATTFAECRKIMEQKNFPAECREAGAFTRQACEKVMFEKYGPKEIAEHLPPPCREAGATDPQSCQKVMKAKFFPKECQEAGLDEAEQCQRLLSKRYLPRECQEAGAETREACEQLMRQKYMAPACQEAGIFDGQACEHFMVQRYASEIVCEGLSSDECRLAVEKRHLGRIVQKQQEFSDLKEQLQSLQGQHLDFQSPVRPAGGLAPEGAEKIERLKEAMPIERGTVARVLFVPVREQTGLRQDESLVQTLPTAVMLDNDADGLPNDLETRIGTANEAVDTDNDGYSDGEEVKNNFNPTGEGALTVALTPVEESIVNQQPLDQPLLSGEVAADEFAVTETVTEMSAPSEPEQPTGLLHRFLGWLLPTVAAGDPPVRREVLRLSGRGTPNSVVTLYIYSEVPIIALASTDASGRWSYGLDVPLADGDHTVYVASLDASGRVVKKSEPFSLFIKGAAAVTPEEFVAETSSVPSPVSAAPSATTSSASGLLIVLIVALVVVALAALAFIWTRHRGSLPPPSA